MEIDMDALEENEVPMSGEFREKGSLSWETYFIFIKACGYFSFVVLIISNILM